MATPLPQRTPFAHSTRQLKHVLSSHVHFQDSNIASCIALPTQATLCTITRIQKEHSVTDTSLLNFVVSDGISMIATRFVYPEGEPAASLYYAEGGCAVVGCIVFTMVSICMVTMWFVYLEGRACSVAVLCRRYIARFYILFHVAMTC